jgi:hypothetical protein
MLFRRRVVYVPTLWGWLALLCACAGLVFFAGRAAYPFLAVSRPVSSHLLVVEGWMPSDQLDQVLDVYRAGGYEHAITTGGPIVDFLPTHGTYAERARDYLVSHGLPPDRVIAIPAPPSERDRSYLNAVLLRDWLAHSELRNGALNVVSSGVHGRRSWLLHELAFGDGTQIGILSLEPGSYDPRAWWRSSIGAKDVLGEAIAWTWTKLFFHPDPAPP